MKTSNVLLIGADGSQHGFIRGDLVRGDVKVLVYQGRYFVRKGWWGRTYVEGHKTQVYHGID